LWSSSGTRARFKKVEKVVRRVAVFGGLPFSLPFSTLTDIVFGFYSPHEYIAEWTRARCWLRWLSGE
jgi:hypothetical protein